MESDCKTSYQGLHVTEGFDFDSWNVVSHGAGTEVRTYASAISWKHKLWSRHSAIWAITFLPFCLLYIKKMFKTQLLMCKLRLQLFTSFLRCTVVHFVLYEPLYRVPIIICPNLLTNETKFSKETSKEKIINIFDLWICFLLQTRPVLIQPWWLRG